MTNYEIINKLAADKTVERLMEQHRHRHNNPYIKDLSQDIYIDLMLKDAGLIERLYCEGTLVYFISRMITNNLYSVNSPFYYDYQRFRRLSNELNENDGL